MGDYTDVLKRLVLYRKLLGLSQRELAVKVGLSQEQYSYIENGRVLINSCLLIKFDSIGLSVDTLIAGKTYNYKAHRLESAISSITAGETKNFILKLLVEIIVNDFRKNSAAMTDNILLLEALSRSWDNFSMLRFVRSGLKLNQIDMAERLGLGIKKYRALEYENIYPDAEMLLYLYNISHYQPALFMNMSDRKLQIIKSVWENFSPEKRAMLLECVTSIKKCIDNL